jgi:peptidoglycan/LPS O-acetylase OafA/YrhL
MNILNSQFMLENIIVIFSLFLILAIPRYSKAFWSIEVLKHNFVSDKKNRLNSIDSIKGMAIVAVIIIHSCYLLLSKYSEGYEANTFTFINNIFRFAIPVFLFSSGLLLRPFIWRAKNILSFYISKIIRIGIPYILVNIALWQVGYNNSENLWQLIITGDMVVPFYFIPVLFQLYFLYPILDYFRKISPKYLLLISLIISVISFFIPITWQIYGFPLFFQYLIFFVYGMLRQDVLQLKSAKVWNELFLIYIILQIIIANIAFFIVSEKNIWESFYLYNFQIILGFGFIFTSLYYLEAKKLGHKIIQKIFAPLGRLSLWIFLLHFPIQQILFTTNNRENLFIIDLVQNILFTLIITIILAFIFDRIYSITKFIKL